jgi:hypothetical protein
MWSRSSFELLGDWKSNPRGIELASETNRRPDVLGQAPDRLAALAGRPVMVGEDA